MSAQPLHILLIEDNPHDERLMLVALRRAGFDPQVVRAQTEQEFLDHLSPSLDVILCDYSLPQFNALRALELRNERAPDVPLLVVSGSIGEETAVWAIKQGATDYLLKDRLARLGPAIQHAVQQRRLRDAEQRAQAALSTREHQYRALTDSIPQIVWTLSPDGHIQYLNRHALEYLGIVSPQELQAGMDLFVHPEDHQMSAALHRKILQSGEPGELELRIRRADGQFRWHLNRQVPVRDAAGALLQWVGTCVDIHDQKTAAEQLARDALLLASVRDSIVVTNLEGIVTYWNEGATRLFGWTADEMVGRPYADRYPEPRRSQVANQIRDQRHPSERSGEYEDLHKDGSVVWIHTRVSVQTDASGQPIGILELSHDITEERRVKEALLLRDQAIQAASQGILITDNTQPDNPIVYSSPGFERMTGYKAAEILGKNCRFLRGKDTDPAAVKQLRDAIHEGRPCAVELLNYRKDGTPFWNALTIAPVQPKGQITHFVGVQTDVTERRKLEEQYRQAQKMEAVGLLAGGVAHDFNNLLTVITGITDMALLSVAENDPLRADLQEILRAGDRAANLIQQLLTFSRRQIVKTEVLSLNTQLRDIQNLLQRLVGDPISLELQLDRNLGNVRLDPSQLEQVVMNLVVNARDAMPHGGKLLIRTQNVELDETFVAMSPSLTPGAFVLLEVSDTGIGMDASTQSRVFEPFFTTKPKGHGTGLGLSTVYGIVKQNGGAIRINSELEVGTSFRIYLPRVSENVQRNQPARPTHKGGTEARTILIVDDEEALLHTARRILENAGYSVLTVSSGHEALQTLQQYDGKVHLVLTDVMMPGLNGPDLAAKIAASHPPVKILFASGFADDRLFHLKNADTHFINKPYTIEQLTHKVREVLHKPES